MARLYHFTSSQHLHGIGRFGLTVGDVPTDIDRWEGRCGVWLTTADSALGHGLEGAGVDKKRYRFTVNVTEDDPALVKWTEWGPRNATRATVRILHDVASGFDTWYVYFGVIDPAKIEECIDMKTGLPVAGWRNTPEGAVKPVPPERRHVWHKKLMKKLAVELTKQREQVANAQTPWATIITCSDSRVPPELLFGALGVGELFVARNAGNMVDTATMGTIEYGAEHLGIPLVVVMGHEKCGAVVAACAVVEKHAKFPGSIGPMINAIVPAAKAVRGKPGNFVDNTVRESAKRTAMKVATQSEIVSHLIKANKVKVIAARYDLENGRVEFLN